eukprot:m.291313 g.291313  ORF g.291313 m.291313 type:complete len:62 (+) comp40725_c0_seq24:4122-4307(+)
MRTGERIETDLRTSYLSVAVDKQQREAPAECRRYGAVATGTFERGVVVTSVQTEVRQATLP